MSKVKTHLISQKEKQEITGYFYNTISNLKSKKEVIDFFIGLLTPSETLMFARRLQIAKMLLGGDSYETIRKRVKASNQTITKTDQWLHNGKKDYEKWIENCLKRTKTGNKNFEKSLLDKYPAHRLLKNILQ
ncbi:MAG TPA: YerC/YecD family TrpR-related protein [Candidatus Moranbacteria bacterium]|nr:YerC/YecD family TrpR-related protein [Candidatus Moranbacteria bacterium]